MLIASATAFTCAAEGTQLVRRASVPLTESRQHRQPFPRELSIDPFSPTEVTRIKQGLLAYHQQNPPVRADGIEGCMQWVLLRHGADEPWAPVGFSLPWRRAGALKINGAMRSVMLNYAITPDAKVERGLFGGTVSVPGTRPGAGSILVLSLADRSDITQWLSHIDTDRDDGRRQLAGGTGSMQWSLSLAPVSQLKVASPNMRCTLLAAQCRRYVSVLDDDAHWMPSGMAPAPGQSPTTEATVPIPIARGLRTELAIEDMCPFSRLGLVEGPVNTRRQAVEQGIKAFGIPGNASLTSALGQP